MSGSQKGRSSEECHAWVRRVHEAQSKRSPEACAEAIRRTEEMRQQEVSLRKCKAMKGHAVRSRTLAAESLRQMASLQGSEDFGAAQERWKCAQAASESRQNSVLFSLRGAFSSAASAPAAAPRLAPAEEDAEPCAVLRDAEEEEDEAMEEAADLVGAADRASMAAVASVAAAQPGAAPEAAGGVQAMLQQLRTEPKEAAECAAKFSLYEGYACEVEKMRATLLAFHEESRPTMPQAVGNEMDKQVRGIDSHEAMGIPDGMREWFVFHMMRRADRNNALMAGILDTFEKKLQLLASCSQAECPICLDEFAGAGGPRAPETLGCCHKVCKECWEHWAAVMHGRPFCPLCRHDDFLGEVAAQVSGR